MTQSSLWQTPIPPRAGVEGLPSFDAAPLSNDRIVKANQQLTASWPANVLSELRDNPAVRQLLLGIGALHNFGRIDTTDTNNWLVQALPPPCAPEANYYPIGGALIPSCAQHFPYEQAVPAFIQRVSDAGLAIALVAGDADALSAMIYPYPEFSGEEAGDLSLAGWTAFRNKFVAILNSISSALGESPAWTQSGFQPPFGGESPTNNAGDFNVLPPPSDQIARIRAAAFQVGTLWPIATMPVQSAEEGMRVSQAVIALGLRISNFGRVGEIETNNWFQSGTHAPNDINCAKDTHVYNPEMMRCVFRVADLPAGARLALDSVQITPNVKAAIYTGDIGKLGWALMQDGYLDPLPRTMDIFNAVRDRLNEAFQQVAAADEQPNQWKVSDYVPTEIGITPAQPAPPSTDKPTGTEEEKKEGYWTWKTGLFWGLVAAGAAWAGKEYVYDPMQREKGIGGGVKRFPSSESQPDDLLSEQPAM